MRREGVFFRGVARVEDENKDKDEDGMEVEDESVSADWCMLRFLGVVGMIELVFLSCRLSRAAGVRICSIFGRRVGVRRAPP